MSQSDQTRQIKVADLSGCALDWAVAVANDRPGTAAQVRLCPETNKYRPTLDGAISLSIIESEQISIEPDFPAGWFAIDKDNNVSSGPTLLVAAMRSFVTNKLGPSIELPIDLLRFTEQSPVTIPTQIRRRP